MKTAPSLGQSPKIIVIALNGIGNLIMATPMIASVKKSFPRSTITVLTLAESVSVVQQSPFVDQVLIYPSKRSLPKRLLFLLKLRKHNYDASIYPYPNLTIMSAIMGLLIGAKVKANFQYTIGGKFTGFLSTISPPVDFDKHDVEKNLELASALGAKKLTEEMFVTFTKDDEEYVDSLLNGKTAKGDILIAMHIGSKEKLRVWPTENFANIVQELSNNKKIKIILIGRGEEQEMAKAFPEFQKENIINLIEKTTIPQTTALLRRCDLLIGNDSGPTHMAASVGTQTLVIYLGPHIRRTAPYGKKHVVYVEQRDKTYTDNNKNHIYVDRIEPEMVIKKARVLLK